jgi:hypothetical protein
MHIAKHLALSCEESKQNAFIDIMLQLNAIGRCMYQWY